MAEVDGQGRYVVMRFNRVKTWGQLEHVRRHNTREMDCRHLEEGEPEPKLIFGNQDAADHIRYALDHYGIKERPGEVLALEFVISTSREVFEGLDKAQYKTTLQDFMLCAGEALMERFTIPLQIVSMTLHEDERTPHLHALIIPLIHEPDNRRKDKSPIYRLSAKRVVGGRGDMSREQTRFASHFESMGLVRGKMHSRARHVSNRDHEEMLEDARQKAMLERDDFVRERTVLAEMMEEVEHDRGTVEIDRQALESETARLATERAEVERDRKEAEALKGRALARIEKTRRLLIEGERFEEYVRALAAEKQTAAISESRNAARDMSAACREEVVDDDWLARALFARDQSGASR